MPATIANFVETMRTALAETRAKLRAAPAGHPFTTAAGPIVAKLDAATEELAGLDSLPADATLADAQARIGRFAKLMGEAGKLVAIAAAAARATLVEAPQGEGHGDTAHPHH